MKLVKFTYERQLDPPVDFYINPEYVTSLKQVSKNSTEIEFEGDAGYRTRKITVQLPIDEVAKLLEA